MCSQQSSPAAVTSMPLTAGEYSTRRHRARLRQRPDRALAWHWGVRDCEVRSGLIMETDPWYCETSIAILNKEVRWYLETVQCKPSMSVSVYICFTSSLNRFCFNAIHLLRHPTSSLFILRFVIHHSRLKYIYPVSIGSLQHLISRIIEQEGHTIGDTNEELWL